MSVDHLLQIIGILALLAMVFYGRYMYWRGKFESIVVGCEDEVSSWRSEVMFLRRIVNEEAANNALADCEEHY